MVTELTFQEKVALRRHIPEIEDAIKANLLMQQKLWTWIQKQTDLDVQNLMHAHLVSDMVKLCAHIFPEQAIR